MSINVHECFIREPALPTDIFTWSSTNKTKVCRFSWRLYFFSNMYFKLFLWLYINWTAKLTVWITTFQFNSLSYSWFTFHPLSSDPVIIAISANQKPAQHTKVEHRSIQSNFKKKKTIPMFKGDHFTGQKNQPNTVTQTLQF